jgi:hypothetical protein
MAAACALLYLALFIPAAVAQPVQPIDDPGVAFGNKYVEQVFAGRFASTYQVLKDAQRRPTQQELEHAVAINAGFSAALMAYVAISNEVCGEQTIGVPVTMRRKYTETIKNGLGIELGRTTHDTGPFTVSEQLAGEVDSSGFAMGFNFVVLDFTQLFDPVVAVADMRLFFARWPCRSAGLTQFHENLVRYTQRRPSLQEEYDKAMIPARFGAACRESLPGIAQVAAPSTSCACLAQAFGTALDERTIQHLTQEFTRRQFLFVSISAVGLGDKVKECLYQ